MGEHNISFKKIMVMALIVSYLLCLPVMAEGIPPLPNSFSGNVTLNGSDCPVGTEINAYIDYQNDTVPDASINVSIPGYYELHVVGNSEDHNKEITFLIGNYTAKQKAEFSTNAPSPRVLNLSTTGDSLLLGAKEDERYNEIPNPEDIDPQNSGDKSSVSEDSESLDGFSFIMLIGVLLSLFALGKFNFKGDFK